MNVREITILILEPHKIKVFYKGEKIITQQETLSQSLAGFLRNEAPFYENATIVFTPQKYKLRRLAPERSIGVSACR